MAVSCRPTETTSRLVAPPEPRWGVQSGDVGLHEAVIWSRSDREATMLVEWSFSPDFTSATRVSGPKVGADTDLCGKLRLAALPSGTPIHYRVRFDRSEWVAGSFETAPEDARDVTFAWSADTNGQGFGIDPARGGMAAYRALADRRPAFFLHLGDQIYADNPIPPSLALPDQSHWNNLTTPEKLVFAETLADFRGAHRYPRHSEEVRLLSALAPMYGIWDDHEVKDNWFPGRAIDTVFYKSKSVDAFSAHALRASLEYHPTLRVPSDPMYRILSWGPHLDIFLVDGRSFRTPNFPRSAEEHFFGAAQTKWLTEAVANSKATWKIIASDMSTCLVLGNVMGKEIDQEAFGLRNGPPEGRELELASMFAAWKQRKVKNVVFFTADVHYAAAHHLTPEKAVWKEMIPFWEFVAGPMHAIQFGRNPFDDTFGPELAYANVEPGVLGHPSDRKTQTFGMVHVEGATGVLTVTLADASGRDLNKTVLRPG